MLICFNLMPRNRIKNCTCFWVSGLSPTSVITLTFWLLPVLLAIFKVTFLCVKVSVEWGRNFSFSTKAACACSAWPCFMNKWLKSLKINTHHIFKFTRGMVKYQFTTIFTFKSGYLLQTVPGAPREPSPGFKKEAEPSDHKNPNQTLNNLKMVAKWYGRGMMLSHSNTHCTRITFALCIQKYCLKDYMIFSRSTSKISFPR